MISNKLSVRNIQETNAERGRAIPVQCFAGTLVFYEGYSYMEPGIWGFTCWSHTPPAIKLANCGLGGPRWGLGLGCCWVGRGGVQLETEGCFPRNFACCIWSKPINYWDTRIDIISSKSMCRDQQPMIRIRSFFVSLFSLFHSAPPPLVEGFWLCVFFLPP